MVNEGADARAVRTLVLGGARSGKSAFAEELAGRAGAVRYVATAVADPSDADFAERIAAHRSRRPQTWEVVEGDPVAALADSAPVTLIDDVGTWLTARIDARDAWQQPRGTVRPDADELVAAVSGYGGRLVIVSPEVGLGVVPATRSGRLFQDEVGALNQRLAEVCDEVYLVVAGLATRLESQPRPRDGAGDGGATADSVLAAGIGAAPAGAATSALAAHGGGETAVPAQGPALSEPAVSESAVSESAGSAVGAAPEFGPVIAPDAEADALAHARQRTLVKPAGALGRLETLGNWVAACQAACPPRQFQRARVVVFAGDHGVARHGVSAYPSEVTAQMVANFLAGGAAVNAMARQADATVRVVDLAVDDATDPSVSAYKVRRSSGSIDREDALTPAEVHTALAAGKAIADEEVDGGADLLMAGDMGIGNTTPATVLIATLTDTEPVSAIGRGTGVDDAGWMRKVAAIRDAMWRTRPHRHDPIALLRIAGGADLAAAAGYLAQAAARRTPVVLDGVVTTAAALLAEMLAPGAKAWWVAGHRSTEPSHERALTRLNLEPLVELDMRLGEGSGALTALPLLRAAIAALAEMATFADAGVSTAPGRP